MERERARAQELEPQEDGPRSQDDAADPFYDPTSQEYKEALRAKFMNQRATRYKHLPGTWFQWLIAVLLIGSAALWIEGSPAGRVKHFLFDLEPRPGAKHPGMQQPHKGGPGDAIREAHHLGRDIGLGHLFRPGGDQISDISSKVRVVDKRTRSRTRKDGRGEGWSKTSGR